MSDLRICLWMMVGLTAFNVAIGNSPGVYLFCIGAFVFSAAIGIVKGIREE